jgi:hypothetical protein
MLDRIFFVTPDCVTGSIKPRDKGGYMCGLVAPWRKMYENVHLLHTNPLSC